MLPVLDLIHRPSLSSVLLGDREGQGQWALGDLTINVQQRWCRWLRLTRGGGCIPGTDGRCSVT